MRGPDNMRATHLIYIHGFNSSPLSAKAQQLQAYYDAQGLAGRLSVPALPPSPAAAMALLESEIGAHESVALVGSSLGGFYATWLAEQHKVKAVLINPAVAPWKLLDKRTGTQYNYHTGEAWELQPEWVDELQGFAVAAPSWPDNLLLLTQTGDETLDWRDGWDYYRECHRFKGLGGSHGFEDFDAFIPLILRFCGIDKL